MNFVTFKFRVIPFGLLMRRTRRIIFLLCMLMIFKYLHFTSDHVSNVVYNSDWDDWAIGLKTGKSTILKRVPIQMATFLSDVRNLIIFGDEDAIMGDLEMINIIKNSSYGKSLDELRSIVGRDDPINSSEELVPDKDSLGWMMDAHKNLPALEYLMQQFPNAKWFLLIDDDTYLFKHNLKRFLTSLNSSDSHYIGTPYTFNGCGLVPGERSILFAQGILFTLKILGGSGILISHGALSRLIPLIKDCNHKFRDCTAGDVRTALCFKDAGIYLTPNLEFNAFPPSLYNLGPACSEPLTFHHMLPFHFEEMHDLGDHNVTMSTLFKYYSKKKEEIKTPGDLEKDSDRLGLDYKLVVEVQSPRQCYEICQTEKECTAFSYINPNCWLKNGIPSGFHSKGSYSGAFVEKYYCRDN